MLKKRIIFTLLFDNGYFMLSRNFRLQRVGDLAWLKQNYDFSRISFFIDELIVLDVTRGERNQEAFCEALRALTEGCFVPIAAGGGVRSVADAQRLLRAGADKVVVNTPLFLLPHLLTELVEAFGQQCVVGSLDIKRSADRQYQIWIESGARLVESPIVDCLRNFGEGTVGEWYLNSIDRDGTGQGYELGLLELVPGNWSVPIILAGGAGNALHLAAGLSDPRVDAVATAHLFNFVGDGLKQARANLVAENIELARWPTVESVLSEDQPAAGAPC